MEHAVPAMRVEAVRGSTGCCMAWAFDPRHALDFSPPEGSSSVMVRRTVIVLGAVAAAVALALVWNVFGGWPVPSGYSFPRHSMFGGPQAEFVGTLEDIDGCIRAMAEDGSFAVVWPPGYWLSFDDNEPVVQGFTRDAGMGEPVRMGGGYREDGQPPPGSRDIGGCEPPFFLTTGFSD